MCVTGVQTCALPISRKPPDHDDGRKDYPGYSGGRKEEAYGKKSAGSV